MLAPPRLNDGRDVDSDGRQSQVAMRTATVPTGTWPTEPPLENLSEWKNRANVEGGAHTPHRGDTRGHNERCKTIGVRLWPVAAYHAPVVPPQPSRRRAARPIRLARAF